MRHEPTEAELLMWQVVRRHQLAHAHFRRQHSFERFIVDFYCYQARLVIEVDGEIHQYTREEDAIRQEFLESLGLRVIRFTNQEVMSNMDDVIKNIRHALSGI